MIKTELGAVHPQYLSYIDFLVRISVVRRRILDLYIWSDACFVLIWINYMEHTGVTKLDVSFQ